MVNDPVLKSSRLNSRGARLVIGNISRTQGIV
jgi:hypothetical protein